MNKSDDEDNPTVEPLSIPEEGRVLVRTAVGFKSARADTWEAKHRRKKEVESCGWACTRIRPEDVEQNRRDVFHKVYKPLGQFTEWDDLLYGKYVAEGKKFGSRDHYKYVKDAKEKSTKKEEDHRESTDENETVPGAAQHMMDIPSNVPTFGFEDLKRRITESEHRIRRIQAGSYFLDIVEEPVLVPVTQTIAEEEEEEESAEENDFSNRRPPPKPAPFSVPKSSGGFLSGYSMEVVADDEENSGSEESEENEMTMDELEEEDAIVPKPMKNSKNKPPRPLVVPLLRVDKLLTRKDLALKLRKKTGRGRLAATTRDSRKRQSIDDMEVPPAVTKARSLTTRSSKDLNTKRNILGHHHFGSRAAQNRRALTWRERESRVLDDGIAPAKESGGQRSRVPLVQGKAVSSGRVILERSLDPVYALDLARQEFCKSKIEADEKLERDLDLQESDRRENFKRKFRAFHAALGEELARLDDEDRDSEFAMGNPAVRLAAVVALGRLMIRAHRAVTVGPTGPAVRPNIGALGDSLYNITATCNQCMTTLEKVAEGGNSANETLKEAAQNAIYEVKQNQSKVRRGSVIHTMAFEKGMEALSHQHLEFSRVVEMCGSIRDPKEGDRLRLLLIEQLGVSRMDTKSFPKAMLAMKDVLEGTAFANAYKRQQQIMISGSTRVDSLRDLKAMRLEAKRAQLQKLIENHRHHPWYIDLLAEVTKGGREVSKPEQLMVNHIKRIVEAGMDFNRAVFFGMLSQLRREDFKNADMLAVIAFLRDRVAKVSFSDFSRWLIAHELPIPPPPPQTQQPKRNFPQVVNTQLQVDTARRRFHTQEIPSAQTLGFKPGTP